MSKNKDSSLSGNFDDIDDLALSLQQKIKELNESSTDDARSTSDYDSKESIVKSFNQQLNQSVSEQDFSESFEDSFEQNTEEDVNDISMSNRFDEEILSEVRDRENSKTTSPLSKSVFMVISVVALSITMSLLTFFLLSDDQTGNNSGFEQVSLALPQQNKPNNIDSSDILSPVASVSSSSTEIITNNPTNILAKKLQNEEAFLQNLEETSKVKKIPLLFLDDENEVTTITSDESKEKSSENRVLSGDSEAITVEKTANTIFIPNDEKQIAANISKQTPVVNTTSTQAAIINETKTSLSIKVEHLNIEKDNPVDSPLKTIIPNDLSAKSDLVSTINEQRIIEGKLLQVEPAIIIASNKKQWINIIGESLNKDIELQLKWKSKNKLNNINYSSMHTPADFKFVNSSLIKLNVLVSGTVKDWLVSNISNPKSMDIKFNAYPPFTAHLSQKIEGKKAKENKHITTKNIVNNNNILKEKDEIKITNKVKRNSKSNKEKLPKFLRNEAKGYTVQLLSSSKLDSIKSLIAKYPEIKSLDWIKSKRNKSDWFSLLYGQFSSKDEAKKAYNKLPRRLRGSGYWIRPFSDIVKQVDISLTSKSKQLKKVTNRINTKKVTASIGWTIQLITFDSIKKMNAYINSNQLKKKKTKYFKKEVYGKVRYTLVYGKYSTKKLAKEALNKLPSNVKISRPWLKQFSEISRVYAN